MGTTVNVFADGAANLRYCVVKHKPSLIFNFAKGEFEPFASDARPTKDQSAPAASHSVFFKACYEDVLDIPQDKMDGASVVPVESDVDGNPTRPLDQIPRDFIVEPTRVGHGRWSN